MTTPNTPLLQLRDYHRLTKHRFDGYAPGPETLDWDDQPNVFRTFAGASRLELPLPPREARRELPFSVLQRGGAPLQSLTLDSLALFLRYAAGLTAWKAYGPERWPLRANPSSGNLHPGEIYLLLPATEQWSAGVYHYDVFEHALEQRLALPELMLSGFALPGPVLLLTSVLQREAWKYGERALRYCLLDSGHLLGQSSAAAALNGWQLSPITLDHSALAALCGIDRAEYGGVEPEYPELALALDCGAGRIDAAQLTQLAAPLGAATGWQGQPSKLGPRPLQYWRQAEAMMAAFERSAPIELAAAPSAPRPGVDDVLDQVVSDARADLAVTEVLLQRRSAQAYNPEFIMSRAQLAALLAPLRPGASRLQLTPARVHPLLFIHAVEGVVPGIYLLPRSDAGEALLRTQLTRWSEWQAVELVPGLTLWQVKAANTRKAAAQLCCQQAIAAASAVTLMLLGEYEATLESSGSAGYPQLLIEAGLLGQSLYLDITALGLNGTGIGCFFDDGVHELLGIEGETLQALYGFALGEGLRDERVTQLSGYYHLPQERSCPN